MMEIPVWRLTDEETADIPGFITKHRAEMATLGMRYVKLCFSVQCVACCTCVGTINGAPDYLNVFVDPHGHLVLLLLIMFLVLCTLSVTRIYVYVSQYTNKQIYIFILICYVHYRNGQTNRSQKAHQHSRQL